MADERYEWLDSDAAERLLRGMPVDAADERARTDAARLAAALDSAADSGHRYDDGELPGEAAAMAAFRKARADVTAPGAAAGASLGTVRVARAARPGRGLGRPFRFGVATALAGCAIGGVAVAAGSGVLPSFGDERPTPASSVSAVATPGPVASPTHSGPGTGSPSWSPGATGTPPVAPPAPGGTSPSPGGTGMPASGGTVGDGGTAPGGDDLAKDSELYRKTVDACRDYRSGHIAKDSRRRLEAAAKGPGRVERFCDQLLGGGSGDGGSAGSEGSGGSSGSGGGEGGTGGKNSGGAGDRSVEGDADGDADGDELEQLPATPPVSWSLTPEPTAVTSPSVSPAPTLSLAAVQAF
ncbi:hypothetical protein [Streptomyces peucetius]|uniref:Extensin n=1 Tax=Streptomyces peucetius TaxID=1950 RepID=A0ABY6IAF9_STRPE|nr:hypothetical protein [Streptomyces peucetius]UYQ64003.1 hypothetical protein OGH68_22740 [Streptomyces peucetius]